MSLKWSMRDDYSINLEERPGELARLSGRLRDAGINLLGFWGDHAVGAKTNFHCVPESSRQFREFAQAESLDVTEGQTIYIHGLDDEGALTETLEEIATAGVSILAIQAVVVGEEFGCFIWVDPKHWEIIERTLG
jgi:hypothetical protein